MITKNFLLPLVEYEPIVLESTPKEIKDTDDILVDNDITIDEIPQSPLLRYLFDFDVEEEEYREFLLFTDVLQNISYLKSYYNFSQFFKNILIFTSISTILSNIIKKKFFLKKRKWKRFKSLRTFTKVIKYRNIKKRSIQNYFSSLNFSGLKLETLFKLPLINRIPLTQRLIDEEYAEFFYKLNKDKTDELHIPDSFLEYDIFGETYDDDLFLTVYLRNYDQKPYWKLKVSRVIHWEFFFNKSLREQRYKGFLRNFLKKYNKFDTVLLQYITYFSLFQCSWTRISAIKSFLRSVLTTSKNNIIFTPLFFSNYFNWNFFKKKNFRRRKKVGKWSYLNFKRYVCPWLTKKKNFPKRIKHLRPNFNYLKNISQFDPLTGYLALFTKPYNYTVSPIEYFKLNSLIKLHTYRYHAD